MEPYLILFQILIQLLYKYFLVATGFIITDHHKEASSWFLLTIVLLLSTYFIRCIWRRPQSPSPLALPILGHLYLINSAKTPIYHTLQNFSFKYGPFISLRLDLRRVLLLCLRRPRMPLRE